MAGPQRLFSVSLRSLLPPLLVVVAGFLVTGAFFLEARKAGLNSFQFQFERDAAVHADLVVHQMEECLLIIKAVRQFWDGTGSVTRLGFRGFTAPFLSDRVEFRALEWVPRVRSSERGAFEKKARQERLSGFRIVERTPDGRQIPAANREATYPILYVEPLERNETAVGFDLGSDPVPLAALERARDTGEPSATGLIRLAREEDGQPGLIVPAAVYRRGMPTGTVEQRRLALEGFVTGVFRKNDLFPAVLDSQRQSGLSFDLIDLSASPDAGSHERATLEPEAVTSWKSFLLPRPPKYTRRFPFAGRQWGLEITAGTAYMERRYLLGYWFLLPPGFLLTLFLGLYLHMMLSRRKRMERLVQERTAELDRHKNHLEELVRERTDASNRANEALTAEVTERRQAQQRLTEAYGLTQKIVSASTVGILVYKASGPCVLANEAAARIVGGTVDQLLAQNYHEIDRWKAHGLLSLAEEALGTASPRRGEFHHVTPFGKEVWLDCFFTSFTSGGEPHLLLILSDLTERARTDFEIRVLKEFNESIVLNMAEGIAGPLVIAGETPPVDMERLGEVSEEDPDRIRQLINLYLTQADEIMAGLRAAVDAGSVQDVGHLAHKLAGASATCGMTAIVSSLQELEGQANQGSLSGAGRAVARAGEELESIRRFLKDYLSREPEILSEGVS